MAVSGVFGVVDLCVRKLTERWLFFCLVDSSRDSRFSGFEACRTQKMLTEARHHH